MSHVKVDKLWVRYGKFDAVKNLSFQIPKGEVFGFIGPNGAGKTSTIKVMATLVKPYRGDVKIAGHSVQVKPWNVRREIGYLPDFFGVYEDLSVLEYLHFFAAAYQVPFKTRPRAIGDVLELTDLSEKKDALVDDLSRGMKQRLGLARLLLHDPGTLLLDEPASGLDPRARIEMRELLKELRGMGKTIIISSHILSELAELCTRIGIVEQGELVAEGSLDEIYAKLDMRRTIHIQITNQTPEMLAEIASINGVEDLLEDADRLAVTLDEQAISLEDFHAELHHRIGARIRMFQAKAMDMESVFMKLTEGKVS
jgi:ABC-2 type transport system ATP-binding protein